MNNDDIMVSIICFAYNHEKYIRQCLDGFVMQKTKFKYEVIVHDDASTDKTAEIIREYEGKYPNIIKPIYQTENQWSKHKLDKIVKNYMLPKICGKYIAICEGDDFWIDDNKLQKQVEALELNPDCCICVGTVRDANEDGTYMDSTHPTDVFDSGIITVGEFLRLAAKEYVFQTSSFLLKGEEYTKYVLNPPEYKKVAPVGDWPYLLYFSLIGGIYYLKDELSCYRRNSIGSFTNLIGVANIQKQKLYYLGLINMMKTFDKSTNGIYNECCDEFCNRFKRYYYNCLKEERNFKQLLKKEYKYLFKEESFKDRLYIKTSVYFPFIARIYNKIKAKG